MEKTLVSIIVPIYNAEKFLRKCLDSLITQTYQNMDIVLIDDGSQDTSLLIAEEYEKRDTRIRVFSQQNIGLIATRKRGVELAKGDLIGFVDSDDWIDSNMFEQLVKYMIHFDCDLVSSGIFHEYEGEKASSAEIFDVYGEGLYTNLPKDIFPSMLYDFGSLNMGLKCTLVNKLFRKKILYKVYENIDTRVFYGEDALTIYQYCLKCSKIYILRRSFYHYLIRGNSMCRNANEKLAENTVYLYRGLKKAFLEYKEPYILLKQLKQYILQLESHTLKMLYDIDVLAFAKWNFDALEKFMGKDIVLYGAGACGQALYRKLVQSGHEHNVVAWIDKNAEYKSEQCLVDIKSVNQIDNLKYDYIVIAIKNESIAAGVRDELIQQYGIERRKIVWEKTTYEDIFLNAYL